MSYEAKNMSVLAYSNGFTLWHYKTQDKANQVFSDNYFLDSSSMLRKGDIIFMNIDSEGLEPTASIALCAKSNNKIVEISKFKVGV